ncbi:histidine kinase [Paenibacillus sp.]|uniref:sensor histidine kinase n=1 Tax=Paenibacillus sp. TaxID=58172 RepID=UPI002810AC54|nr:histidine kinase [Paenibacillus sp.]
MQRWLLFGLRFAWWVVLGMALVVFVLSRWEGYSALQAPCGPAEAERCAHPLLLTQDGARDLERYGLSAPFYGGLLTAFTTIANMSYLLVGAVVYRYRRRDPYGIAVSMFLIVVGTIFTAYEPALASMPAALLFFHMLNNVGSFYLPFLYAFPDGTFAPRWTLAPSAVWVAAQAYRFLDPETWSRLNWDPVFMTLLVTATHGPLLYAVARRSKRAATAGERRRWTWFLAGVGSYVGFGLLTALPYVLQDGLLQLVVQVGFFAGLLFWPFAFGAGALERSGEQEHASLQKAVFVTVLGFVVVLLYAVAVGAVGALLRERDPLASMIATGVVAVSFHPLYTRLRRGANRLVYGEPESPYETMSRLVERLEGAAARPSAMWAAVAEGVAASLRLPYAAIALRRPTGEEYERAEYGSRGREGLRIEELPLTWNGDSLGALELGTTGPRPRMTPETESLLRHLGRQVSAAAHTVRLAEEVAASRERIVTAREEERRRLGRDLHDGLGAELAGALLRIDAIADRFEGDPELRDRFADAQRGIADAIREVRRLAYSLRPPTLDEFGLAFAVRELALRCEQPSLRVEVEAPERLPPMTAAAETAAYRIVQEALANALRHAGADRVTIALRWRDGLEATVEDDGRGLGPAPRAAGVGIRSMRERAEELGGAFELTAGRGGRGTRVRVVLPDRKERYGDDEDGERRDRPGE